MAGATLPPLAPGRGLSGRPPGPRGSTASTRRSSRDSGNPYAPPRARGKLTKGRGHSSAPTLRPTFLEACQYGDLALVRTYVQERQEGPAKEYLDWSSQSPAILVAAKFCQVRVLEYLLMNRLGFNANRRDADSIPPLHHAVWALRQGTAVSALAFPDRDRVLDLLIDGKADVNAVDPKGRSALWYASKSNNAVLVETLLAAKANPDTVNAKSSREVHRKVLAARIPQPGRRPRSRGGFSPRAALLNLLRERYREIRDDIQQGGRKLEPMGLKLVDVNDNCAVVRAQSGHNRWVLSLQLDPFHVCDETGAVIFDETTQCPGVS
mmetsp:Transcript_92060/g.246114  ORF Transcript_92060/g.246114 Transcript_92060/m.246114 type:complete len:323 (+) Transcript_92060:73-1041(+)